jgi:DNA topoisomerase-2
LVWKWDNLVGKIKYYKGLGTSTSAEAREYFKKIQDLTVKFDMDIMTDKSIVLAFDKKKADDRKSWLLGEYGKGSQRIGSSHTEMSNELEHHRTLYTKIWSISVWRT